MKGEYLSELHEYICHTISHAETEQLPELMGSTSNRCTRILKRPEIAKHDEVLFFSKLLDKSVFFLLETYNLGAKGMTVREKALHRHIRETALSA